MKDTHTNKHCIEANLIAPPGSRARLIINEGFMIEFAKPMPGRWHRFWYRFAVRLAMGGSMREELAALMHEIWRGG